MSAIYCSPSPIRLPYPKIGELYGHELQPPTITVIFWTDGKPTKAGWHIVQAAIEAPSAPVDGAVYSVGALVAQWLSGLTEAYLRDAPDAREMGLRALDLVHSLAFILLDAEVTKCSGGSELLRSHLVWLMAGFGKTLRIRLGLEPSDDQRLGRPSELGIAAFTPLRPFMCTEILELALSIRDCGAGTLAMETMMDLYNFYNATHPLDAGETRPQPITNPAQLRPITALTATGTTINLYTADLKGLLSALVMHGPNGRSYYVYQLPVSNDQINLAGLDDKGFGFILADPASVGAYYMGTYGKAIEDSGSVTDWKVTTNEYGYKVSWAPLVLKAAPYATRSALLSIIRADDPMYQDTTLALLGANIILDESEITMERLEDDALFLTLQKAAGVLQATPAYAPAAKPPTPVSPPMAKKKAALLNRLRAAGVAPVKLNMEPDE
ncbi:hypothetical protein HYH03_017049 [Edaphochlamys debaryana]|uniref:Uncharacterized protein n=1 Tax=Edaphochlamys debaryana TaxID=47281 RepID=A0A835XGC1_9CHLO|nr:hypothetical protein HYH03_017049 [Edaphochlamys debaryana]|eukprot:KAG2484097.1 hypothetical protein HYH03_017049 [Edaphochlamys debaryana]